MREIPYPNPLHAAQPRKARHLAVWMAVGVVGVSLIVRLMFLHQMLARQGLEQVIRFNWDSREYVHLAQNLAGRGQYVYDTDPPPLVAAGAGPSSLPPPSTEPHTVSHFFGLLRTPGYP